MKAFTFKPAYFALALGLSVPALSAANDSYASVVMKEDNHIIVSGKAMSVEDEDVVIQANNKIYKVDTDDIDLDLEIETVITPGTMIAISGEIEDQDEGIIHVDANNLILIDETMSEDAAIKLLDKDLND